MQLYGDVYTDVVIITMPLYGDIYNDVDDHYNANHMEIFTLM